MKIKQQIGTLLLTAVGLVVLGVGLIYSQQPAPAQGEPSPAAQTRGKEAMPRGRAASKEIGFAQERVEDPQVPADINQPQNLPEMVALADKDVAIKRAALKVSNAQKMMAEAKLRILKSKVVGAQVAERQAKVKLERMKQLSAAAAIGDHELLAAEAGYQSALAFLRESEETITLGEAEVALEVARAEVSQAELEKAELRLKQLQSRRGSQK